MLVQYHYCLLPASGHTTRGTATSGLAFTMSGSHVDYLHVINLLNRLLNLGLIRLRMHLKRIRPQSLRLVRSLLRYQGAYNYLVLIHLYFLEYLYGFF